MKESVRLILEGRKNRASLDVDESRYWFSEDINILIAQFLKENDMEQGDLECGVGHNVLDDPNPYDDSIDFCINYAKTSKDTQDPSKVETAQLLGIIKEVPFLLRIAPNYFDDDMFPDDKLDADEMAEEQPLADEFLKLLLTPA